MEYYTKLIPAIMKILFNFKFSSSSQKYHSKCFKNGSLDIINHTALTSLPRSHEHQ